MKPKRTPGNRLTHQEWLAIQAKYEAGERVVDLAKKYNVSPVTISRKANTHGWKPKGSLKEEALQKAKQAQEETLKKRYAKAIEDETEYDYKVNRLLKDTIVKAIKVTRANIEALERAGVSEWMLVADEAMPGETKWILVPKPLGKLSGELNTLQQSMRSVQESQRETLRLKETNPFEDNEVDEHRLDRLRALMTPVDEIDLELDDDEEAAGEENKEGPAAIHTEGDSGEQGG